MLIIGALVLLVIWNMMNKTQAEQFCSVNKNNEKHPYIAPQFYLKNNRYAKPCNCPSNNCPHKIKFDYTNKCGCEKQFSPEIDWSVKYESGANGTYKDLLWNKIEPRMILQDNSMKCCQFKGNKCFNAPTGITDHPNIYDSPYNLAMYSDQLVSQSPSDHTLSCKMDTGIVPIQPSCVDKAIYKPSCGCNEKK